jgi:pimeloyl-ACP methyl ester carboxylesterase
MADLADLMAAFARTVAGGPCDVVAESFGGWVALWLAAKHPGQVRRLVVQGPAGLRDPGTGGVPADPAARMRALYAHPERAPKETRTPQMLAETQQARDRYIGGIDFDEPLHGAIAGIAAPTLIVMGTKDTVAPVVVAHRIKAAVRDAQLAFIDGAAHSVEFDAPEQVGPLIAAFLEGSEAAR